jgi:hypothetical protein
MRLLPLLLASLLALACTAGSAEPLPTLKISENRRFLVTAEGKPFFYLGDTAWELFHRLTQDEAAHYLETRAKQGFTVIQAVVLAELDGLNEPNAHGQRPLRDNDPTQPNPDYFAHVEAVLRKAESLGLYVGLLPTWGDKWNKKWGVGPEIFTPANAAAYGEWLGRRFKDRAILWIVGGDRPIENETHAEIVRAMAQGIRRGDGGRNLITFHPQGGQGSAQYFHAEPWLDFNMRQNGHNPEFTDRYAATYADYQRTPVKPVLDGEPIYEGHPVAFNAKTRGHSIAADVRRPLYWNLFTGACGHTYGHHSVWQMFAPGRKPVNAPLMSWREALEEPGAQQMKFGRLLLESRPYLTRIPDDSVIVPDAVATSVPGAGLYRFVATRDSDGSYAMVYAPVGRTFRVRLDKISGSLVRAWWFNPRNGHAESAGEFARANDRAAAQEQAFTPPTPGEALDWVLVLDDAAKNYPAPRFGTR